MMMMKSVFLVEETGETGNPDQEDPEEYPVENLPA